VTTLVSTRNTEKALAGDQERQNKIIKKSIYDQAREMSKFKTDKKEEVLGDEKEKETD
jgi:hypothetical protein